nr:hypothetical protein CFP56_11704 [Quercus suber]
MRIAPPCTALVRHTGPAVDVLRDVRVQVEADYGQIWEQLQSATCRWSGVYGTHQLLRLEVLRQTSSAGVMNATSATTENKRGHNNQASIKHGLEGQAQCRGVAKSGEIWPATVCTLLYVALYYNDSSCNMHRYCSWTSFRGAVWTVSDLCFPRRSFRRGFMVSGGEDGTGSSQEGRRYDRI